MFSCARLPLVCLLWTKVYLHLLTFFDIKLHETFAHFGASSFGTFAKLFSHSLGGFFFFLGFLCCVKAFKFNWVSLVYAKECSACGPL